MNICHPFIRRLKPPFHCYSFKFTYRLLNRKLFLQVVNSLFPCWFNVDCIFKWARLPTHFSYRSDAHTRLVVYLKRLRKHSSNIWLECIVRIYFIFLSIFLIIYIVCCAFIASTSLPRRSLTFKQSDFDDGQMRRLLVFSNNNRIMEKRIIVGFYYNIPASVDIFIFLTAICMSRLVCFSLRLFLTHKLRTFYSDGFNSRPQTILIGIKQFTKPFFFFYSKIIRNSFL